jgi:hypothetical protein
MHARSERKLEAYLRSLTADTVAGGPFAGMRLARESCWSSLSSKLVGCYEEELHGVIEDVVRVMPRCLVDVGCAEGYYAVGLARRLPEAQVYAFDIDAEAQRICRSNAAINGVGARVHVHGACLPQDLQRLAGPESFFLLDCEGAELSLLDPTKVPALARTMVLVELHDFIDSTIKSTLVGRFSATHDISIFQSRPLRSSTYRVLSHLNERQRSAAINEHRPVVPYPMEWALFSPK